MKILFICKRRPQQRDLLSRPYGRFYNLPIELARLGHEVTVILIDFKNTETSYNDIENVRWICLDIRKLGIYKFFKAISYEAKLANPDWVFGLSDTWTGWLAHKISIQLRCKLAIDAYDNYESYMPWNKLLHLLWRRAIKAANVVTVAGPQLANLLGEYRSNSNPPEIIPMSADATFIPINKSLARTKLNLPSDCPLVGYYGSWAQCRGTDNILDIFKHIQFEIPNAKLVLSGNPPDYIKNQPGVICLGYIEDQLLPYLVNAIDVACIITRNSSFGKYSYPAKLCEAMACRTAIVATATEPVKWMLGNNNRFLVPINNPKAFSDLVIRNMNIGKFDYHSFNSWATSAQRLNSIIKFNSEYTATNNYANH